MATAGVGLRFALSRKGKGPPNNCGTCTPGPLSTTAARQPASGSPSKTKPHDRYVSPTYRPAKPPRQTEKPWRKRRIADGRAHMAVHVRFDETLRQLVVNSIGDIANTICETHRQYRASADSHIDVWLIAARNAFGCNGHRREGGNCGGGGRAAFGRCRLAGDSVALACLAPMRGRGFRQYAWLACRPGLPVRRTHASSPTRHYLRARDGRRGV
jgi:hypothetical protein